MVSHLSPPRSPARRGRGSGCWHRCRVRPGRLRGGDAPWSAQSDVDADHAGWLYRGDEREPVARESSSQADLYRAVAAALSADDPQAAMPVDPWDAVHVLAVVDAARTSAREERVVTVVDPSR